MWPSAGALWNATLNAARASSMTGATSSTPSTQMWKYCVSWCCSCRSLPVPPRQGRRACMVSCKGTLPGARERDQEAGGLRGPPNHDHCEWRSLAWIAHSCASQMQTAPPATAAHTPSKSAGQAAPVFYVPFSTVIGTLINHTGLTREVCPSDWRLVQPVSKQAF